MTFWRIIDNLLYNMSGEILKLYVYFEAVKNTNFILFYSLTIYD